MIVGPAPVQRWERDVVRQEIAEEENPTRINGARLTGGFRFPLFIDGSVQSCKQSDYKELMRESNDDVGLQAAEPPRR